MANLTPEQFHSIHKGWNNKLRVLINGTLTELNLTQFTKLAERTTFDYNGKTYRIDSGMVKPI